MFRLKRFTIIIISICIFILQITPLNSQAAVLALPNIYARNAVIIDVNTGRSIYEKDADKRVPMASTTKIMTALITLEQSSSNDVVVVSHRASVISGSTMKLVEGEHITVMDLLYGLLIVSGNDAAIALAEYVAGSVEEFCALMNTRAFEMGAYNTSFTSPHGLDNEFHYTTAKDLALIAKTAMDNIVFRKIVSTQTAEVNGHYLKNTNDLLFSNGEVTGIKTGFTNNAGRCMVIGAKRDDFQVVAVILGCDSKTIRTNDGKKLVKYALDNFKTYDLLKEGAKMGRVEINYGIPSFVDVALQNSVRLPLSTQQFESLKYDIVLPKSIEAPVESGTTLGKINISSNNIILTSVDLIALETSRKKNFCDYMEELFTMWVMTPLWKHVL